MLLSLYPPSSLTFPLFLHSSFLRKRHMQRELSQCTPRSGDHRREEVVREYQVTSDLRHIPTKHYHRPCELLVLPEITPSDRFRAVLNIALHNRLLCKTLSHLTTHTHPPTPCLRRRTKATWTLTTPWCPHRGRYELLYAGASDTLETSGLPADCLTFRVR